MRFSRSVLIAVLVAASACSTTDPVFCTAEARAGINVTVVDRSTGSSLVGGATLTLREGDFVEIWAVSHGGALSGAWERAGTYEIAVAHEGYDTWTKAGVVVGEDECHVIPVTLDVSLERIDPSHTSP